LQDANPPSILSPTIPASHTLFPHQSQYTPPTTVKRTHLVEAGHRLICTTNLHLKERRLITITSLLGTLHLGLIRIIPGTWSAKDIFSFLPDEILALKVPLGQDILVRACLALETIDEIRSPIAAGDVSRRNGEDIAARGANWLEGLALVYFPARMRLPSQWDRNLQSSILIVFPLLNITNGKSAITRLAQSKLTERRMAKLLCSKYARFAP
jgi:hypothetical protein